MDFEKLTKIADSHIKDSSEQYNYEEAVKSDIVDYINDNYGGDLSQFADKDEAYEALNDELWTADSVTGNGSGSYWFNRWKAEEAICHNLDLLGEAVEEFGGNCDVLKNGAEACDVTIRCYLLGQVLGEVLDDYTFGGDSADEEEEVEEEVTE